jgi:hypothetical protein
VLFTQRDNRVLDELPVSDGNPSSNMNSDIAMAILKICDNKAAYKSNV